MLSIYYSVGRGSMDAMFPHFVCDGVCSRSVEKVQTGKNGGTVDPEMQETVETVPTNDPGMDGKIFRSLSPAYVWTLPYILRPRLSETGEEIKSYRFLIRPEQIITYKLRK